MPAKTHGKSRIGLSEYDAWKNMKARCYRDSYVQTLDYKGRGIKVSNRWLHSFDNFISDMGYKPTPAHTLDRIDNNGDYEPANCRWATRAEQNINKRYYNKTGVRGIQYNEASKKYIAYIYIKGKTKYLGSFSTKEEAVKARDVSL